MTTSMPDLWMGINMLNILVLRLQFSVFHQLNPIFVHICERSSDWSTSAGLQRN
jgi:hypothetical protein